MKLFISWSGARSKELAFAFKTYLPKIVPSLEDSDIFMSSSDIQKGEVWFAQIQSNLESSDAVLVLLTEENIDSPWIMFESGAVSNKKNSSVFTYLIDEIKIDSKSPLFQYQSIARPNEDNTQELMLSLYKGDNITQLTTNFINNWVHIESTLVRLKEQQKSVSDLVKIESRSIRNEALKLVNESADSPFSHAFNGWYSALVKEVITPAHKKSFIASPKFYHYCLFALDKAGVNNIKAIADLSRPVENWNGDQDDLWVGVSERIFHIDWECMFNDKKLSEIVNLLNKSIERSVGRKTKIYLVTNEETVGLNAPKLSDNQKTLGYHLLLLEPSLVGGYIKDASGESLYLEATSEQDIIAVHAARFYKEVKEHSMIIYDGESIKEKLNKEKLRKLWIKKGGFGVWENEWNTNAYPDSYCKRYDINIRLWTPDYEKLLDCCSDIIQEELIKLFRKTQSSLNILEIGYGTGALTSRVWAGIHDINEPGSAYQKPRHNHCTPVAKYYGTDSSACMKSLVTGNLSRHHKKVTFNFDIDIRDDEFHIRWALGERVDIVFGSLILHFIIQEPNQNKIEDVFSHLSNKILKNDIASMIFLCIIFSEEEESKNKQLSYWKNHMVKMGYSNEEVTDYMNNNQNMINSPSYKQYEEAAHTCGFILEKRTIFTDSPFCILSLNRTNSF